MFELVSLRSCLLGSSSRSLLLHPIHQSIIRFALLLFGLPAQFLRASPGGILFQQRSLRFSNAGKAGFTASELRWDVLFSLFNAQPLVFLLVDRARSLQQFFDLERQPLLLLVHPLVGHRLVLARVRLHLRAIECDVSEPHQTCFLAKLQDFEEERFQCLQVDQPKLVDRREVGMTFSSQHPEWNVFVGRPRDPPRRIDAGAVGVQKQRDHHSRRVRSLASRVLLGVQERYCFATKPWDQVQASKSIRPTIDSRRNDLQELLLVKVDELPQASLHGHFRSREARGLPLAVEYADAAEDIAQELNPVTPMSATNFGEHPIPS